MLVFPMKESTCTCLLRAILCVWLSILPADFARAAAKPAKAFSLTGQSNLETPAVADLEGKDTLNFSMRDPEKAALLKHLRDDNGQGTVRDHVWTHQTNSIEGWTVLVSEQLLDEQKELTAKALELLRAQLKEIVRVVPAPAVAKLREVALWFSPEYPGVKPTAEYHPGRGWLVEKHRDPAMVNGVEFTNVRIFEKETKRMPNFALHELAHAFHDRVLGFEQPDIIAAYGRAKAGKAYDSVERWHGDGRPNTHERAYAMTDHKEYFAECTEAFFGRNDYFPFTHDELESHDPTIFKVLKQVWKTPVSSAAAKPLILHTRSIAKDQAVEKTVE